MNTFVPSSWGSHMMMVVVSPTRSPTTSSSSSPTTYSPLGSCLMLLGVMYAMNSLPLMVTSRGLGRHIPATTLPMDSYRSSADSGASSSGSDATDETFPEIIARARGIFPFRVLLFHLFCHRRILRVGVDDDGIGFGGGGVGGEGVKRRVERRRGRRVSGCSFHGESFGAVGMRTLGRVDASALRLKLENMPSMPSTMDLMPSLDAAASPPRAEASGRAGVTLRAGVA